MNEDTIRYLIEFSDSISRLREIAVRQLLEISSKLKPLESKSENKPLYNLNLLDIVPTEEPHTSKFLSSILQYTENGEYIILKSFINRFLSHIGLSELRVKSPRIETEKSHIDVCVLDNDYAVIIENKLMNAPFQRNQLGRYIESVHRLGYDYSNIFVVILPQYYIPNVFDDIRSSVWKCPPDGLTSTNGNRLCHHYDQYHCWCDDKGQMLSSSQLEHCQKCKDFKPLFNFRTIVLQSQLCDWLSDINQSIDPKQIILKSAIVQFADFIGRLFNLRINHHLLMDIQELIRESILPKNSSSLEKWDILHDKLNELGVIQTAISSMKLQLSKDLIDEWYHQLKPEFGQLQREVQKSFGINVRGVWIGCWCGSNNNGSPYWGFYCENKGTSEQQKMVSEILAECDTPPCKSSPNYISWNNTRHGADKCLKFYRAAQKLGYL